MFYTLPYIGEVPLLKPTPFDIYLRDVAVGTQQLHMLVEFTHQKYDTLLLDKLAVFLGQLPHTMQVLHGELTADLAAGGNTHAYLEHHLSELPPDHLANLLHNADTTLPPTQQLLSALHPYQLTLRPQSNTFAVLDYTLGTQMTNYVIAINLNEQSNVMSIEMES